MLHWRIERCLYWCNMPITRCVAAAGQAHTSPVVALTSFASCASVVDVTIKVVQRGHLLHKCTSSISVGVWCRQWGTLFIFVKVMLQAPRPTADLLEPSTRLVIQRRHGMLPA